MIILLLHNGRVGSTVVGDMLSQHHQVDWHREIFSQRQIPLKDALPKGVDKNRFNVISVQIDQLDNGINGVFDLVNECRALQDTKVVIMTRKNSLKKLASILLAKENGIWHSINRETITPISLITSLNTHYQGRNLNELVDEFVEKDESLVNEVVKVFPFVYCIFLSYERHVETDPKQAYELIRENCGLEQRIFETDVRYLQTEPIGSLDRWIVDLDDVVAELEDYNLWMVQ